MTNEIYDLNSIESKRRKIFNCRHWKKGCRGSIWVMFTHTGIGTKIKMKCSDCNIEKDITDYNCW